MLGNGLLSHKFCHGIDFVTHHTLNQFQLYQVTKLYLERREPKFSSDEYELYIAHFKVLMQHTHKSFPPYLYFYDEIQTVFVCYGLLLH